MERCQPLGQKLGSFFGGYRRLCGVCGKVFGTPYPRRIFCPDCRPPVRKKEKTIEERRLHKVGKEGQVIRFKTQSKSGPVFITAKIESMGILPDQIKARQISGYDRGRGWSLSPRLVEGRDFEIVFKPRRKS